LSFVVVARLINSLFVTLTMAESKKILLLGAGGFIGCHLTHRLLADGVHSVTAVDLYSDKIQHELDNPRLTFVQCDIRTDSDKIEKMVEENDICVDLIAFANPGLYVTNPVEVFHLNFTENMKIVEMCVKHNKRLVQFSTCEVYGITAATVVGKDPKEMPCPFKEDETPLIMGPVKNQRWIYACAKQLLERVLHAYGLEKGLNYTIIRPFNFVGPQIDYLPSEQDGCPRVFSHFMNGFLYGTPIRLVNGGTNLRGYTYIDDAIDCIARILDNPGGKCDREIFNIGRPENELSIKEMAYLMKDMFNEHFKVEGDPSPEIVSVSAEEFYGCGYEDCDRRIADITKARTLLGWEPKYNTREVVYKTMEAFVKEFRDKQQEAAAKGEDVRSTVSQKPALCQPVIGEKRKYAEPELVSSKRA